MMRNEKITDEAIAREQEKLEIELIREEMRLNKQKKSRLFQLIAIASLFFVLLILEVVLIARGSQNTDSTILYIISLLLAPQLLTVFWFIRKY